MKNLKKTLSVILTAAMLFALAGTSFAVEFKVSAPTPERAWCVAQYPYSSMYCDISGDLIERGYNYIEIPDQPTYYRTLSYYVEKDGTFTEPMMKLLQDYIMDTMKDLMESGDDITLEAYDGMEIPENIYDYLRFELEIIIKTMKLLITMPEAEALGISGFINAFLADYPDSDTLYTEIMDTYFDGNKTPAVTDMIYFLYGEQILLPSYGVDDYHIMYYYDEYVEDDEGWFINISDIVAPNGAYYNTSFTLGKGTNVYANLENMIEEGWTADPWFSFDLITGYATDNDGYLYTRVPEYVYVLDTEGNRTKDFASLVDDEGNVIGKDVSLREMAVEALVETYKLIYGDGLTVGDYTDVPEIDKGDFDRYMSGLIEKYFDILSESGGDDTVMSEEEMRTEAETEIDSYIAEMEEYGEAEFIPEMLFYISGYSTDAYGYIYEDVEYGYVTDADGNRIHADDVMDKEGNLLIGEYAGRSAVSVLKEFMANIDSSALLKGDTNGDRNVNLSDITAMLKTIAGWENVECDATASDTNGDGTTTLSDVSLALQYIAGWDVVMGY